MTLTTEYLQVPLSEFAMVNGWVQLRQMIAARIDSIEWYREQHYKNDLPFREKQAELDLDGLKWMLERLDNNPHIEPPSGVRKQFDSFGPKKLHIEHLFSYWEPRPSRLDKYHTEALNAQREATKSARAAEIVSLIQMEIAEKLYDGWFVLMSNLTVSQIYYNQIFGGDKIIWKKYLRDITRDVGAEICGSRSAFKKSGMQNREVHTYCAIVERGGAGRLHIHVVHCIKKLPAAFNDPNSRREVADAREIAAFRKYWPAGFSACIACRFHGNDPFARLGWKWPVKRVDGIFRPIEPKPPAALAQYVGKYLVEGYGDIVPWRTKTSRRFGETMMQTAVGAMTTTTLENLMITIQNTSFLPKINRTKMSPMRLRRIALRESVRRMNAQQMKSLKRVLLALKSRPNYVMRLQEMSKGRMMEEFVHPNYIDTRTMNSISMAISDARGCFELVFEEYELNCNQYLASGRTT